MIFQYLGTYCVSSATVRPTYEPSPWLPKKPRRRWFGRGTKVEQPAALTPVQNKEIAVVVPLFASSRAKSDGPADSSNPTAA
jgi:hypothetical protein